MTGNERSYIKQSPSTRKYIYWRERARGDVSFCRQESTYLISLPIYNSHFDLMSFYHRQFSRINLRRCGQKFLSLASFAFLSFSISPFVPSFTLIRQKRRGRKGCERRWSERGEGGTDVRTEEAFIRVRHVFPRWRMNSFASLLSNGRFSRWREAA